MSGRRVRGRWVKAGDAVVWAAFTAASVYSVLSTPMQWKPVVAGLVLLIGWNSAVSHIQARDVVRETEDEIREIKEKKEHD